MPATFRPHFRRLSSSSTELATTKSTQIGEGDPDLSQMTREEKHQYLRINLFKDAYIIRVRLGSDIDSTMGYKSFMVGFYGYHLVQYRKTLSISVYMFSGLATVRGTYFQGRTYFRGCDKGC